MEDRRVHESHIDGRIAAYLERQSQKVSRRGLLASAGRFMLRLSGLALLPLLPFDRRANAQLGCSWRECGMCGNYCSGSPNCCNGNNGGTTSCPSCMTTYGSWTGCCNDGCANHLITYTDCGSTNVNQALQCRGGLQCLGGCATPGDASSATFYGGSATYACTFVTVGAANSC